MFSLYKCDTTKVELTREISFLYGDRKVKIAEIMTSKVVTAGAQATISEVAQLMTENGISGVPVVDADSKVLGIVTERDLLPKMKGIPFSRVKLPALFGEWLGDLKFEQIIAEAKDLKASEVMTNNLITVNADDEISLAAELIAQHSIKRLPVLRDGVLEGIVTRADIIRAISSKG